MNSTCVKNNLYHYKIPFLITLGWIISHHVSKYFSRGIIWRTDWQHLTVGCWKGICITVSCCKSKASLWLFTIYSNLQKVIQKAKCLLRQWQLSSWTVGKHPKCLKRDLFFYSRTMSVFFKNIESSNNVSFPTECTFLSFAVIFVPPEEKNKSSSWCISFHKALKADFKDDMTCCCFIPQVGGGGGEWDRFPVQWQTTFH